MDSVAEFNWWIATFLFVLIMITDALYSLWMIAVHERKPFMAAIHSSLIYVLGAFATIGYVENHWYLVPIAMGGGIGSFLATKYKKADPS